jgi:acetyltransferase-like isoleucine patch superfamily enzyme
MPITLAKPLLLAARRWRLRLHGAKIDSPRLLAPGIDCRPGYGNGRRGNIEIGRGAWIEQGAVLHAFGGTVRIGQDVFLGPHVVIYGHGGVEIGDACLVAMHCRIVSSNHAVPPVGTDIRSQPDVLLPTKIGRDVWLGAGVTVLGGVTIGDGCIVGAGAVVTDDLPAGSIAHGVPAVVRGFRPGASAPS